MSNESENGQSQVPAGNSERLDLDLSEGAFASVDHFKQAYNMAKYLCQSSMVPKQYQGQQNIGNCIIALEMAQRIGASPFAVMQNLDIIHGNPSWRSQFVIASLNSCGRFSPIRYRVEGEGDERTAVAWAYDKSTGEVLEGPPISIKMAKDEGWFDKNGSKWKTIPELMLRYRAAKWFGNLYAPDITMGMHDDTEVQDIVDVRQGEVQAQSSVESLNQRIFDNQGHTEPQEPNAEGSTGEGTDQSAEDPTEGAQAESSVIECPNQDERPISKQYCNETCTQRDGCPAWD